MRAQQQTVLFDAPGPRGRRTIVIGNVIGAVVVAGIAAYALVLLGREDQLTAEKWQPIFTADAWENFFLPGIVDTLRAAGVAIVGAIVFGLLFGIGRLSALRAVRWLSGLVVEFFRAVPVLLMMIFFWLFLAQLKVPDAPFWAVVIALVLYNGSVVAELVRSGVYGLPKGQHEAALAVGLTRGQSLRSVEVPQALIAMLPALVSQLVVVLKDTALGYIITYTELLQESRRLGSAYGNILQALLVAAVLFITINYVLSKVAEILARRLKGRTAGPVRAATPGLAVGARGAAPVGTAPAPAAPPAPR
ncbi:amino acid ABC transporter permease [Oerskovia sp. Sa1BUA8]|uniref:Amino acid ABC transporter permease n=1 Tax=Oerskovia douganii TaxID=2762210 RepID=A0A9D5YXH0_9CELL|nr:amino acid ABC transporter permease [Oerskovia douganii]MBE7698902.1 amino acid ABC transporter permease [Oerskovia douganii]